MKNLNRLLAGFLIFSSCIGHANAGAGYSDPFAYAPDFNGGYILDDRFAEAPSANTWAQKTAVLSNGDVVSVGLVPAIGSTFGSNVGLVHYSSLGARIAWPSPTAAYASYYNIYLTFPNVTAASITAIDDVKVAYGFIFVLAEVYAGYNNDDVNVLVLTEAGQYVGYYAGLDSIDTEWGIRLVPYQYLGKGDVVISRLLLIGGRRNIVSYPNGPATLQFKRFAIDATGALIVDTTFGSGNGIASLTLQSAQCGSTCSGPGGNDAVALRTTSSDPTIYVTGELSLDSSSAPTGFMMAIDGSTGTEINEYIFQQSEQYSIVATTSGAMSSDILYLLGDDVQACGGRINGNSEYGVTKMYAVGGLLPTPTLPRVDSSFGSGGQALIASPHYCTDGLPFGLTHLVIVGSRLVVVGTDSIDYVPVTLISGYFDHDPLIATLRISDGKQTSFERIPALRTNGTRWGNAEFDDSVTVDPNHVLAAGIIGDIPGYGGPSNPSYQFGTALLGADDIFSDDFETN